MWLGASDIAKEGTWIWESSKTALTYSNWFANEPNNERNNENCLHLWAYANWNDLNCDATFSVLCEVVFPC